jgi:hypothetical protein
LIYHFVCERGDEKKRALFIKLFLKKKMFGKKNHDIAGEVVW